MGLRPLFALMTRSLVVEWRSNFSHVARLGVAVLVLLMLISVHEASRWLGAPGQIVLGWLGQLNAYLILMAAASFFATSIAEEKEERILSLLRMTSLNSLAILLGKSASRLISTMVLVLVQVPFFFLVVPLGGTSTQQVLATAAALFGYLIMAAGVGVFFSVVATRAWQATLSTLGLLGVIWFVGVTDTYRWLATLANWALTPLRSISPQMDPVQAGDVAELIANVSVHERLEWIQRQDPAQLETISTSVVGQSIAGGILFLLAWVAFEFLRQDEPSEGGGRFWRRTFGARRRVRHSALEWSAFHVSAWGYPLLIARFIGYPALAAIMCEIVGVNRARDVGEVLVAMAYFATLAEFAFIGERFVRPEIKAGTLSTILMLPRTVRQVLLHRLLGFLPGLIPLVLMWGVGLILSRFWRNFRHMDGDDVLILYFLLAVPFVYGLLVAWLSLFLRWGATFAGLGIGFVAGALFAGMMVAVGGNGEDAVGFFWDLVFTAAIIFFLIDIPKRILRLGAAS